MDKNLIETELIVNRITNDVLFEAGYDPKSARESRMVVMKVRNIIIVGMGEALGALTKEFANEPAPSR